MEYIQLSLFGKTSSEPSAPTKAKISGSSSKRSSKSSSRKPMCLEYRKADGPTPIAGWVQNGALLTELSTLNTGESHSVAVESTLSSILEDNVPEKYFLSAKACEGILRRAERRGKELPTMLREALEYVISQSRTQLKIRSGCEGGGKGPLIQEDKSATLATNNDQYLFVPAYCIQGNTIDRNAKQNGSGICEDVAFTLNAVDRHGVVAAGFKAGQGVQARGIGWQEERSPTLTASNSGTQLAPTVCVAYDARGNGDGKTASTITGDHENRITDYTTVVCMANGQANAKVCENCAPCLNCNHEQPIVFDKEVYNSGVNATGGHYISEGGPAPTLRVDGHPPGVCVRYIVRRLTPTECARLQGFPDRWGDIDPLDISDEREVDLWREIYKTYCIINGLKVSASILSKPERLKEWHDKLHTDSAEYKMWGNGIALPNALYVMQGIEEALNNG